MIHSLFFWRRIHFVLLTGDLNDPAGRGICEIRLAASHDVPLMAKMLRTEDVYDRRLQKGYKAVICISGGEVVHMEWFCPGPYYIWDGRITFDPSPGGYYLFDLYTRPDFRGCGIWRRALREVLESLRESHGEVRLFSAIDSRNITAMRAHLKGGFTGLGTLEFIQICGLRKWKFSMDEAPPECERGMAGISAARLAYDGTMLRLTSHHKGVSLGMA